MRRNYPPRRSGLQVVDSIKDIPNVFTALAADTTVTINIAVAQDAPVTTGVTDVKRGSKIFRIWVEFWIMSTVVSVPTITNGVDLYIIKNPGANLTVPTPSTVGTSNEKKFVFKTWKGLIGTRTEGFPAYSWKGWIKIPKIYQRMGTDDRIDIIVRTTGVNGLICLNSVYKWFS